MKKLMTACAACMMAGLVSAEVSSLNVVGYTSIDIAADTFSMVGVQFETVGGGSAAINDLFAEPTDGAFTGGSGIADADYLQVWDPGASAYIQYYFGDWAGAFGAEYDNLWYKDGDDAAPTTDVLAPGAAVWFARTGAATAATVAGQVVGTADATVAVSANTFTMIANPFPTTLALADVTVGGTVDWINSGLTGGSGVADADYLQVWDPGASAYVQYYFGDWAGAFGAEYDKQWYKDGDDAAPAVDVLPVGGAAWLYHTGASLNLTIPSPL